MNPSGFPFDSHLLLLFASALFSYVRRGTSPVTILSRDGEPIPPAVLLRNDPLLPGCTQGYTQHSGDGRINIHLFLGHSKKLMQCNWPPFLRAGILEKAAQEACLILCGFARLEEHTG